MQKKYFLSKIASIVALMLMAPIMLAGNSSAATSTSCTPPPSASGTTNQQHYCIPDCASGTSSGSGSNNTGCTNQNAAQCSASNCDIVKAYINPAINIMSGLVGTMVVINILIGAVQYSASGGDPQAAAKARGKISGSVIALIAFAFLYAFLQWLVPGGLFNNG